MSLRRTLSLPTRERELKRDWLVGAVRTLLSLPTRERELKPRAAWPRPRELRSRSLHGSVN